MRDADIEPTCGDGDHPYPLGDFSQDCYTNMTDLSMLAGDWISGYLVEDLTDLASDWLECTNPGLPCNYMP